MYIAISGGCAATDPIHDTRLEGSSVLEHKQKRNVLSCTGIYGREKSTFKALAKHRPSLTSLEGASRGCLARHHLGLETISMKLNKSENNPPIVTCPRSLFNSSSLRMAS